jgi:hypothetical protein
MRNKVNENNRIWEAAVLVLLMGGIHEVHIEMASGGVIKIKFHEDW